MLYTLAICIHIKSIFNLNIQLILLIIKTIVYSYSINVTDPTEQQQTETANRVASEWHITSVTINPFNFCCWKKRKGNLRLFSLLHNDKINNLLTLTEK